jgi:hypothetical protein
MQMFYTKEGGLVQHIGPLDNERILIIMGRDNFRKDENVLEPILGFLAEKGYTLVWFEPPGMNTAPILISRLKKIREWPRFIGKLFYVLYMLRYSRYWKFIWKHERVKHKNLTFRCDSFSAFLYPFCLKKQVVILARSSGGVISSRVADGCNVHKMICLAYPFKHPNVPFESERVAHLESIQTPFLILQGKNDEYGTFDTVKKSYTLSSAIRVHEVDTDHDFSLSPQQQTSVIGLIEEFLAEDGTLKICHSPLKVGSL